MTRFYPKTELTVRTRDLVAVGQDAQLPPLRRHFRGGIDYDHYLKRGRHERSKAFHRLAPAAVATLGRVIPGRELVRRVIRGRG